MNFSSWSIRNPIAVILLFLALTIAGLVSFGKMRIQNMPDMDYPMVTWWPGRRPASRPNPIR